MGEIRKYLGLALIAVAALGDSEWRAGQSLRTGGRDHLRWSGNFGGRMHGTVVERSADGAADRIDRRTSRRRWTTSCSRHRLKLIDLNASLQKQETIMQPLMEAEQPDESKILAQIDAIAQARAELEKANARMLLGIRQVMTPDQWTKLKALRAEKGFEYGRGSRDGRRGPGGPPSVVPDGAGGPPPPQQQME